MLPSRDGSNSLLLESGQISTEAPLWGFWSQVIRSFAIISESCCHSEKLKPCGEAMGWCASQMELLDDIWHQLAVIWVNHPECPAQSSLYMTAALTNTSCNSLRKPKRKLPSWAQSTYKPKETMISSHFKPLRFGIVCYPGRDNYQQSPEFKYLAFQCCISGISSSPQFCPFAFHFSFKTILTRYSISHKFLNLAFRSPAIRYISMFHQP